MIEQDNLWLLQNRCAVCEYGTMLTNNDYMCSRLFSIGNINRYINNGLKRPDWCPLVELPEKHGYWSETKGIFECSECGYSYECEGYKHYFNFCPCCGAKMESEG